MHFRALCSALEGIIRKKVEHPASALKQVALDAIAADLKDKRGDGIDRGVFTIDDMVATILARRACIAIPRLSHLHEECRRQTLDYARNTPGVTDRGYIPFNLALGGDPIT